MDAFEQGAYVWFDHPEETWCPATVLSGASAAVHVALVGSGQEFTQPASSKKFMLMNKQNLEPAPDMVKLGDLHEAALLHNLRLRLCRWLRGTPHALLSLSRRWPWWRRWRRGLLWLRLMLLRW